MATLSKLPKTTEEASKYLLENYTVKQICDMLAEKLLEDKSTINPISVTEEQFNYLTSLFKIKGIVGYDDNGEAIVERRGRKKKQQML